MSFSNWDLIGVGGAGTYGNNAGNFTDGGWKLCIHMTEGSSIEGAIGAYKANNSWPHGTIDPKKRRKVRHLDLDVAARSLANNNSDGYQVGRAKVIQIEVVGFSAKAAAISEEDLTWIAECFDDIRKEQPFPLDHPEFKIPATRLTDKAWPPYSGIVGHEHAPDNDHWDPGALDVKYIVSKMEGTPEPSPEPEFKMNQKVGTVTVNVTFGSDGKGQFSTATPFGPSARLHTATPIAPFLGWDYGAGSPNLAGSGYTGQADGGVSGYLTGGKPGSKVDIICLVTYD